MVRDYKERIIQALVEDIQKADSLFITELTGAKGGELVELRRDLRASGTRFMVVKNSLAKIALERCNYNPLLEFIKGTTGMGICSDNPAVCSKTLMGFAKGRDYFTVRGAVVEGEFVSSSDVAALAALPSREALLTKVATSMQAPIRGFVYVLNENLRKLACIINELTKRQQ